MATSGVPHRMSIYVVYHSLNVSNRIDFGYFAGNWESMQSLILKLQVQFQAIFGIFWVFWTIFLIQYCWVGIETVFTLPSHKGSTQKKNTGLFGNFSQHGGGGASQFPKLLFGRNLKKILTSDNFVMWWFIQTRLSCLRKTLVSTLGGVNGSRTYQSNIFLALHGAIHKSNGINSPKKPRCAIHQRAALKRL